MNKRFFAQKRRAKKVKYVKYVSIVISILVLFFTCLIDVGCASSTAEQPKATKAQTWRLAHIRPSGTRTDVDVHSFANEVAENTNGRINIEIYPNRELGDYTVVQERVSMGDVEMQLASMGTSVDRTLGIATCTYLVTNWDEARKIYNTKDGALAKYIAERLKKQNIKLLCVYPQYFGSIALAKEPVEPKNPNTPKNVKLRVPTMKHWDITANLLGFMTTPLPSSEIFTALQTGIVDGTIGGGAESYYVEYKELIKYLMPVKVHFETHWLYINQDVWDTLSPEDQKVIQEAARKLEDHAFKQAEREDGKYLDLFKQEGAMVYDFSEKDIQVWADKIRTEGWPLFEKDFGKEIFDILKQELGI